MRLASTRLRLRLVLMALIAVVPAIAAMAYSQSSERRHARERTFTEILRLVRLAATQQASVFDGARRLLLTLGEFPTFRAADAGSCREVLPTILRDHPGFYNIAVATGDGTLFCAGAPVDPRFTTLARSRAWFARALQTKATALGDLQVSVTTGKPAIIVAHPLLDDDGRVVRVLAATIGLEQLYRAAAQVALPAGATLTLFDRSGTILARVPEGERWVGQRIADQTIVQRLSHAREDIAEALGNDGVRRLYVTVPIDAAIDTGLYVGMGVPHATAFAEADQLLVRYIWLLVIVSTLVIVATLVGSEAFVLRPVRTLSAVASRLASGDFAARAELARGVPGLRDVGDALDAMAATLDARQRELQASEARYRLLFEQNPHPMWVSDLDTLQFLEVNEAAVRHYGYARDEFLRMRLSDLRPPDDAEQRHDAALDRELWGRSTGWRHRLKSGAIVDVELTSHALTFGDRSARLMLAQDVTDRKRAEGALRSSEGRKSAILESALDGIVTIDGSGRVLDFNPAAERMFGYRQADAMGKPMADLIIPPDLRAGHHAGVARHHATGAHAILGRRIETRGLRADGSEFPVELTVARVANQEHDILFTGYIRDISERRRAEQTLRDSEERFRRITETIGEVFWMAEGDPVRMVYVSPAYERIWGRTCQSLSDDPDSFLDSLHPEDRDLIAEAFQIRATGRPFSHEYRIVRPDGEVRWIWDRGFPVPSETGRVVQYVGAAQDVTERLRAETARHDAEERMRFALDAAEVGVWEANLASEIGYWSETFQVMHGLPAQTFTGTFGAFIDRVHPDDRTPILQAIQQAIDERRTLELEYRTPLADGTERRINLTGHFFYDADGKPRRAAGVAIDVTERRSLEDQLRQAQKMEAVGQLAGGIAHDFNNMLTAILGHAELLHDALRHNDRGAADVEQITQAAQRAASLTHQLLAFSRKQILTPRVLHLGDVVNNVTPMLRRLLGETIELHSVVNGSGLAKADAGQMQQVLVNLAVNARDAMPGGGHLTIETGDVVLDDGYARRHPTVRPGPHVMVAVTDSGHGMDTATQKRAFEPFFTTKPTGQGTGLGLATVYGIVKQSGGHIWIYSEVGHGTTFKVYLPRADEAMELPKPPTIPTRIGGDETVLLVEDEDLVRNLVHSVLSRYGYTVHALPDPAAALAFVEDHQGPIHLVLSDVVLPGMNGPAMVAELSRRHPESHILYMSGYTDDAIVRLGLLDSGVWFLQKPFTADVLLAKIREVLHGRTV